MTRRVRADLTQILAAAEAMRRILIDRARRQVTLERGGKRDQVALTERLQRR